MQTVNVKTKTKTKTKQIINNNDINDNDSLFERKLHATESDIRMVK